MKTYLIIGLVYGTLNIFANYILGNFKSENKFDLICLILGLAIGYVFWPIGFVKAFELIREFKAKGSE